MNKIRCQISEKLAVLVASGFNDLGFLILVYILNRSHQHHELLSFLDSKTSLHRDPSTFLIIELDVVLQKVIRIVYHSSCIIPDSLS